MSQVQVCTHNLWLRPQRAYSTGRICSLVHWAKHSLQDFERRFWGDGVGALESVLTDDGDKIVIQLLSSAPPFFLERWVGND